MSVFRRRRKGRNRDRVFSCLTDSFDIRLPNSDTNVSVDPFILTLTGTLARAWRLRGRQK
jgi:hypothetical protein